MQNELQNDLQSGLAQTVISIEIICLICNSSTYRKSIHFQHNIIISGKYKKSRCPFAVHCKWSSIILFYSSMKFRIKLKMRYMYDMFICI